VIPPDASIWGNQVASAYAIAANPDALLSPPPGWSVLSRLHVTEKVLWWSETSLIGFILTHPIQGEAVVTRGTMNPFDWLADFDAVVTLSGVDLGFSTVFSGTTLDDGTPLASWISGREPNPILLTGHSMGGSLATIGAKVSMAATGKKPRLLTFASPRTLGILEAATLGTELADGSSRIVNLRDLVPEEPPPILLHHVGIPDDVDSNSLADSPPTSIVARHSLSTYLKLLA
jgi:hypothetical protein